MAACRGFLARPPHFPGFGLAGGARITAGVSLLLLGLFLESVVLFVVGSSPLLPLGFVDAAFASDVFAGAFAAEYWLRPRRFCFLPVPFLCELSGARGVAEAGGLGGCDVERTGVPIGLGV